MIENIPTAIALNDVALRLYFSAWNQLTDILIDFERVYERSIYGEEIWTDEWNDYVDASQADLQSICALIAHSNELALKAKICEASPIYLLIGNNPNVLKSTKKIDFSELRTLDPVDLPGCVNSVCSAPLSKKYVSIYNEVRSLRNKIAHLGQSGRNFDPDELFEILIDQYTEIWSDRVWLKDRVEFASQTRLSFFHDRHFSAQTVVMEEWPTTFKRFTKSPFRKIFGYPKNKRRYLCHECFEAANTGYSEFNSIECSTAFLEKDGAHLHCVMCDKRYSVVSQKCTVDGCKGNVFADSDDAHKGKCHTCGEDAESDNSFGL